LATYYADGFAGRRTASGAIFRQDRLTCATNALPLGTVATVTNRDNGASVEVEVNDRMPAGHHRAKFDLTRRAAERLGMVEKGVVPVVVVARPSAQPDEELREEIRRMAGE
jgi:rare lipoprotein A